MQKFKVFMQLTFKLKMAVKDFITDELSLKFDGARGFCNKSLFTDEKVIYDNLTLTSQYCNNLRE